MAGAALGFLSGAAIGALGQYGAQKQQQKAQHEANFGQFMQQGVMTGQVDPQNPDAQKALKKYWGENYEAGMQMLQARQAAKLQLENQLKQTIGKGPPQDLQGWQTYRDHLNQMRLSGIYQGPQQQALDKEIQFASQQVMQYEREASYQKEHGPEAIKAATMAREEAALDPSITSKKAAAEATISASRESAGARAKLGVEGSSEALKVKEEEAAASAKGRAEVPPPEKPETALQGTQARSRASEQAARELAQPGKLFGSTTASPEAKKLRTAQILVQEGRNPLTGMRLTQGDLDNIDPSITTAIPDGQIIKLADGTMVRWRKHAPGK